MTVKEYMVNFILHYAADNSHGYSNDYPKNQWWRDLDYIDCGSLQGLTLHEGLLQIGIDFGYQYFEPMGKSGIYNEALLLKYCDKYGYYETYDQPGDILVSSGHTEMVTRLNPKKLTGARNDYDGQPGDWKYGTEICETDYFNNGWLYIYRLKDKYNKEITEGEGVDMGKIPEVKKGDISNVVMSYQYLMHYKLGYDKQAVTGVFDDIMEFNVKYYQEEHGLIVDGRIGEQTGYSMIVEVGYEAP